MYSVFVYWDAGHIDEITGLGRDDAEQIRRIYDKHKDVSHTQIGIGEYDIENTEFSPLFTPLNTGKSTPESGSVYNKDTATESVFYGG